MASRAKHAQRSHKTYRNNASVFVGFHRNAMTVKQRIEANNNKASIFEKLAATFNRFRYGMNESK